jgi:hypothetical protein
MGPIEETVTRRTALRLLAAALLLPLPAWRELAHPSRRAAIHPTPRPGITAAKVLPPERVPESAREAYAAARAIPEVLDGVHCYCDCAERDGLYSLLSCFETEMPITCGFCLEEAKMAHRLTRQGKALYEVRAAIDAEFA